MSRALLPVLISLACTGCIHFKLERVRDGSPEQVLKSARLLPGKTTLHQTIVQAGPPDVMLRAGHVDRLYYTAWDSDYFKFVISAELPVSRATSADVYTQTLGWEDLHLARLEFDREGVLRDVQTAVFKQSRNGRHFLPVKDAVWSQYLEDKTRALALSEMDDDDEDVEIDEPARKKKQGN